MCNKEKLRILQPQSGNKPMFDLSYKSQSKQLHLYRLQMVADPYGPCQRYRPQTSIIICHAKSIISLTEVRGPSVSVTMTSLVSLRGFHAQASRSAPGYATACWNCSGCGRVGPAGAAAGCAWGGKPAKVVSVRLADAGAGLAWAMALHLCVYNPQQTLLLGKVQLSHLLWIQSACLAAPHDGEQSEEKIGPQIVFAVTSGWR